MPRARKGSASRKGGQRRRGGARGSTQADSGSSEDEAASETHSTTSECASLLSTAAEDSLGGDALDEQGQQEDLEEKLKEYVDCLTDKSAKTRQGALESLRLALASHLLPDFLLERRLTLADALEKCLRKGKGEEQALAAAVLGLLCVQLGPGSRGEELFHSLQPLLVSVLSDSTASPAARLHCASALGLGCYVAAADVQDLVSCLTCLEGVFSRPCGVGGSTAPVFPVSLHGLLCAALQAWALLLTICPSSHISHILDRRTLFMRTWRPSAVPCALWPPTAISTVPRLTAGVSALLSVLCCTLLRVASVRRRRSDSGSRCSMWTAGLGAGSMPPSRMCWDRACTTTSRTTSYSVTSLAWALCWCWMPLP
ncbi:interferon-related developmental regulator 2 isoform X3 [Diceros bicornis minor]|uniref:interferon-related developmental regulator 2 isoform X3 n=1 Tax=Diceros bicornis minor TaxID=77932 RepID=UPI0026F213E5|nr:interferon-related developmental regulator 2 isoform X3 [Diceros bicornis minor]XP_058415338.1 interferon-related developmental regulator 2 isoform X3 [Diceros bicornis minor]